MRRITDKNVFLQDAQVVAPFLLGKILARKLPSGEIIKGRITELEIYAENDTACHAFKGKTKRNAPMFEEGGSVYVYLCYGLFNLLNIVCNKNDIPQALLIRGVDKIYGSGRVSKFFQIDKNLKQQNVLNSQDIWLEDDGFVVKPKDIKRLKRVGIDYASEEDINRLWRLHIDIETLIKN